jgi:hypothetical protein
MHVRAPIAHPGDAVEQAEYQEAKPSTWSRLLNAFKPKGPERSMFAQAHIQLLAFTWGIYFSIEAGDPWYLNATCGVLFGMACDSIGIFMERYFPAVDDVDQEEEQADEQPEADADEEELREEVTQQEVATANENDEAALTVKKRR